MVRATYHSRPASANAKPRATYSSPQIRCLNLGVAAANRPRYAETTFAHGSPLGSRHKGFEARSSLALDLQSELFGAGCDAGFAEAAEALDEQRGCGQGILTVD